MMDFLGYMLEPLLAEATKATQPTGFTWRDVISLASIAVPLLLGLYLYLVRKKQEAEKELQQQQMRELREAIKRAQDDVDEALEKVEETIRKHLEHQTGCVTKYVNQDVYKDDMKTQAGHVASVRSTIDTLNTMLVQQQQLMTNLVKTLS